MKRFLSVCALAIAISALNTQQASAWKKCNFNIGMNFNREAAENNFLWGAFRNGPHPFSHQGGHGGFGHHHGYGLNNPGLAGQPAFAQMYPGFTGQPEQLPFGNPGLTPVPSQNSPAPLQSMPYASAPFDLSLNPYIQPVNFPVQPYIWYGN